MPEESFSSSSCSLPSPSPILPTLSPPLQPYENINSVNQHKSSILRTNPKEKIPIYKKRKHLITSENVKQFLTQVMEHDSILKFNNNNNNQYDFIQNNNSLFSLLNNTQDLENFDLTKKNNRNYIKKTLDNPFENKVYRVRRDKNNLAAKKSRQIKKNIQGQTLYNLNLKIPKISAIINSTTQLANIKKICKQE